MKKISYSKEALRALTRMSSVDARRIVAKVEQYAEEPLSLASNVKKLQGVDYFRLRVGDWRVIFSESGVVIDVIRIAQRGEVYRGIDR